MKLWRPVGLYELLKIRESGLRAFPPRLVGQPIFYPVLNYAYAEQIARDWNTQETPYVGFVTEFKLEERYAGDLERQVVGSEIHEEFWIPAEELAEFNSRIVGSIRVMAAFYGSDYVVDPRVEPCVSVARRGRPS